MKQRYSPLWPVEKKLQYGTGVQCGNRSTCWVGIVKSTFDHHERNYQRLFRAITPTEHSRRGGDNNTENACPSKIRAVE